MTSDRNTLLRLDENGIPILDEVVEPPSLDDPAAIKAQLLAELEPQLLNIVHSAMSESLKAGALEFTRLLERQLDRTLEIRVHELVIQAVERAFRETDS